MVARLKDDFYELYKYSLQLNTTIHYGALSLLNDTLILKTSLFLMDCEPARFMKSLTYIAAKADELEELFIKKNIY